MKIVITGANGAVGQAILRCGSGQDMLVAAVRSERAKEEIRPLLGGAKTSARISYTDPASLDAALQGADAVIHLAGILIEQPGSTYEVANVASVRGVVEAAQRCGVAKFVLVSATGADETSSNGYYRSKGQAEALVRSSGLRFTILRAPLLLGPATEGAAALVRNARKGSVKLIGGGTNFQQPLYVDDLARAALSAVRPSVASGLTLDVVGSLALPDREILERIASALGLAVQIGSISKGLLSLLLRVKRMFSGPGFSADVVEVIAADTRIDPKPAAEALGIQLTGIDEMIQNSLGEEQTS